MKLDLIEWGTRPKVGVGYGADVGGKWCSFLETKKGAYRGNHIHTVDQYTVLLGGSVMIVKQIDGELVEFHLRENEVHKTSKGLAHIVVPLENSIVYEWWQGPFEAEGCSGIFDKYIKSRVGPDD